MIAPWTACCRPAPSRCRRCISARLQRDWSRAETCDLTTGIAARLGGGYGLGIIYGKAMFGASEAH
jgi:hypothetical protein